VQTSALGVALAPDTHYRLFVVFEQKRLIAVAGHHPEALVVDQDKEPLPSQDQGREQMFRGTLATRLNLVALSIDDQGRCLEGHRLSDLVMESLIHDALDLQEPSVLSAIVARDNLRSLALCERHGLRSQIEHDQRHLRLSGHFSRPTRI
jgi:hypothetical protein